MYETPFRSAEYFLNLPWKSEEFKAIYETVCLGEVGTTEKSLASLPSLIYHPTGSAKEYFYMLPACTYPNGRMYMKIGSDNDGIGPTSLNDISEWFKSDGNQTTFKNLKKEFKNMNILIFSQSDIDWINRLYAWFKKIVRVKKMDNLIQLNILNNPIEEEKKKRDIM